MTPERLAEICQDNENKSAVIEELVREVKRLHEAIRQRAADPDPTAHYELIRGELYEMV